MTMRGGGGWSCDHAIITVWRSCDRVYVGVCVCVGGCKMTGVPYSPVEDVLLPYLRLHFVRKWAGEETRSVTQVRMVSTNTLCSGALRWLPIFGGRDGGRENGWQRLGEGRKGEWLATFGEIKHGRKEDQLKSKINRIS